MRKKDLLFIIVLVFFAFQVIVNSNEVVKSISFSMEIWKKNIFPCLFPFFIISDLLINYGFIEIISKILSPVMSIYKINRNCAFVLALSMISGFPSNAKYTKKLYDNKIINEKDASKILTLTHFSNPLFILGTVSMLLNHKLSYIILISHYLSNFIVGLFFRNYYPSNEKIKKIDFSNKKDLINSLTESIINTIDTLLLLLGIITTFLVITTIIKCNININPLLQNIINGLIEMTQGIKYISSSNISIEVKAIIISFIISFGGICIHTQVKSILKGTNIKYLPYFIARVLHGIISSLLTLLFIYCCAIFKI